MTQEEYLFQAVSALFKTEQAAYLDKACAGQPVLRARVEALLLSQSAEGFMEDCCPGPQYREFLTDRGHQLPEQSGDTIGRYRLLQQIGEGGFGTVWMAEQTEPMVRRVALKIIKAGMDTREVIARFEAERQALAMMDHPNIAKVLDAGSTAHGRPFFVMELVKGISITKFCDEQEVATRQRLELFADVCSAINHAHQKGIIHRDIKPSNVMVTLNAGRPVVQVIDFGIAKATQGRLTEKTLLTRFEQFMGTPAYMSPEQAALSELDTDTRCDIYGLGILLYELLTGGPPFDTKTLLSAGYEEMRRIIREVEPQKPSSRLMTFAGNERTAVAKARNSRAEKLSHLVEPDLDWIVMKAIEKDRSRRYETVNGLAMDIRRFLFDEPVSAGPPSAGYRFRKFARRHKAVLRTGAAIATVLVAATVVSTSLAFKAGRAEQQAKQKAADETAARRTADEARRGSEAVSQFFAGVFRNADPSIGSRDITVVESINRALATLDDGLSGHQEEKIDLQRRISWTLHTLGFTRQIIPSAEKTREFYVSALGPHHEKSLSASLLLAFYYNVVDRLEDSLKIYEDLAHYERTRLPERNLQWLQAAAGVAVCYDGLNRRDEALRMRRELFRNCRLFYGDDDMMSLRMMAGLSNSLYDSGSLPEALILREERLAIRRRQVRSGDTLLLCQALQDLAQSYQSTGRLREALLLREEAETLRRGELQGLGTEERNSPYITTRLKMEAAVAGRRFGEAVQLCRELVRLRTSSGLPTGENPVPEARLANALLLQSGAEMGGDSREAEDLIENLLLQRTDLAEDIARVDLFSRHVHWKEAARLCRPLYESHRERPEIACRLAPLLVETGDAAAYEKLCGELLQPFVSSAPDKLEPLLVSLTSKDDGQSLNLIARIICLRPLRDARLKWAVLLADRVASLVNNPSEHRLTKGLAAFRHGNDAEAITLMEAAIPRLPAMAGAAGEAVRAMAGARRGDPASARAALAEAKTLLSAAMLGDMRIALHRDPYEWLFARILVREAESVVGP
ncbi:MAG: putative Mitogen-activated protein kinase kinase [Verrucomicrobiales bacterium]|nr:putative Mitogen-activated protein kinase kinase [Verrucomicrobiales bacterium]